jgi:Gpi18-like mannosyltransferase
MNKKSTIHLLIKSFLLTGFYLLGILVVISFFNFYPFKNGSFLHINNLLTLFFRWDSFHYYAIVTSGYNSLESVFFPLYPFLIKLVSYLVGPFWAGFLISWVALALSLFVFYKLLSLRYSDEKNKQRTIALLLFSPFAFFLAAYYTEALFLLLSLSFFYFLKKKKWLWASILGFLACLTRNIGVFLILVYLFEYWRNFRTIGWRFKVNKNLFYSLIIISAPIIYALFCYFKFGNALSFITEQSNWTTHAFMWPWQAVLKYFSFFSDPNLGSFYGLYQLFFKEVGAFLILLASSIYFFKKREYSYAIYGLLSVLLFSCIVPMLSVNRYALVFFPLYIFLNEIFKKDLSWFILFFLSFIYFIFNLFIFSQGQWVG